MHRQHGAFINARYSTDNQNPDSIDVQVSKCTQYCNQHGIPILGVFADEAVSGMKDTRPQFDAMMSQLRMGLADTVVIYDQSRMFRKMTAWFSFRDELAAMGVSVVSVTQPMIGGDLRDPTNFLTEGSMALFNQIWALQTRQKVMEKMQYMARNGQHTGGKPPLGYNVQDGKLVICPEEAATVRRIFEEYASGSSYKVIIDGLNRDGIKTKRGSAFGSNSLHDLLHNEKYIGTLVYGKSLHAPDGTRNTHGDNDKAIRLENAIPAIIDRELFDAVQTRMGANKRRQSGRPSTVRDYPLRGKVFCGECKSPMSISTSRGRYHYYQCTQKKRQHNCDSARISAEKLEQIVAATVRELLRDPDKAEKLVCILREQRDAIQSASVSQLQALIAEQQSVKAKLDNASDAILNGLSSPTLIAKIKELEHRSAQIDAQMRALKAKNDAASIPENRLREYVQLMASADYNDVAVYLSIVYRVEVTKESITIWTIWDTNPDGTYDFDEEGVLLTPGVPSAPPAKHTRPFTVRVFLFFEERATKKHSNLYSIVIKYRKTSHLGGITMTDAQQKAAAKQFVKDWTGHGDEKQETQRFWIALLQNVFGVEQATNVIEFEVPVKLGHVSFIDGYLKDTNVLIEQKGADIDLRKGYRQSDGSMLTPFQQARRYAGYMPHNRNPRWIVVCNFKEFHIHDMNRPNDTPEVIALSELEKEYHRLQFLVDTGNERIQKEMQISLQAGELVGKLYDSLLKQYKNPSNPASLKSLNMLCVRLVFCLYAEDAGIFGKHGMFHDYLQDIPASGVRKALVELFRILDTKPENRDPYLADDNPTLAAFPYVNGGLFADENIEIPPFTEDLKTLLLSNASEDFNWSEISPTIFGAVFESTLNPETRRSGGMHYTSIENIHKVIDPLFYDALAAELDEITAIAVKKTRDTKLSDYQKKLASLTFLDPACGSGNFLTETYLSLRRLENKAVAARLGDQIVLGDSEFNPIQVSIGQFYGIEINDFAVTVAKTALWIAESQMLKETEEIVHMHMDFLPLTSYANIVEGNALRIDWEDVVPKEKLNYIMGNPPFVGYTQQTKEQKDDIQRVVPGIEKTVDYVAMWYFKASEYIEKTSIRVAFVSTNSITQGEQVIIIWKPLFEAHGIHIDFAHQSFIWDSEASLKAHVHCVIVGFSQAPTHAPKYLFSSGLAKIVTQINPYLLDAPTMFITKRSTPLCCVPQITKGSQPTDGGNLIVTAEQYAIFARKEPNALKYIKPFLGAEEFINGKQRYCLWLVGISPKELSNLPMVLERVTKVRDFRLASKKEATRKWADKPTLFTENRQPNGRFIAIPEVSSGNRKYVPMAFLDCDTICSNKLQTIQCAKLFHFGVLMSNVHIAWMKKTCGRLKSDYDYSAKIVYNNFPWPTPTAEQKAKVEQTAQAILDARALYPDCSLADLYDEVTMPPELRKAHQQNDKAVMQAYGFWGKLNTETECVAELMKMYQELTK